MAKGRKTGGRKAGTPNKITKTTKENIEGVFEALGGMLNMVAWAQANSTEFYKIYARLLPIDPPSSPTNNMTVVNIIRHGHQPTQPVDTTA